jgi:hypothetical protein
VPVQVPGCDLQHLGAGGHETLEVIVGVVAEARVRAVRLGRVEQ